MDVVSTRRDELLHVITVRGEIDLATAGDLLLRLMLLAGSATGAIVLDLSWVTFIDCTGLRTLLAVNRHACTSGGSVQVAAASPAVARLFELVGLHAESADVFALPDLVAALDGGVGVWPMAAV